MAFVTLDQARKQVGDSEADEARLTQVIAAAEAMVLGYMKAAAGAFTVETLPADVHAAILLQVAELWRFHGDDVEDETAPLAERAGEPTPFIRNLVYRHRDPTLA